MPPASDWRSLTGHEYLKRLNRPGFAWEFLRRNPRGRLRRRFRGHNKGCPRLALGAELSRSIQGLPPIGWPCSGGQKCCLQSFCSNLRQIPCLGLSRLTSHSSEPLVQSTSARMADTSSSETTWVSFVSGCVTLHQTNRWRSSCRLMMISPRAPRQRCACGGESGAALRVTGVTDLTHVDVLWFKKRIENWIRFGRIAEEKSSTVTGAASHSPQAASSPWSAGHRTTTAPWPRGSTSCAR